MMSERRFATVTPFGSSLVGWFGESTDGATCDDGHVSRTVAVGEISLAILEAGAGGRPLMLVHAFTSAKEDFADHVEALAGAGWHVAVPDLRGHGKSGAPPHGYDFDIMAADL